MTKTANLPRYGVMNHDNFLGYVQGKNHADAMARARKVYTGKRLTLEPIRTGRHPLGKSVQADLNSRYQAKRGAYATPGFEARRAALIAEHKATQG